MSVLAVDLDAARRKRLLDRELEEARRWRALDEQSRADGSYGSLPAPDVPPIQFLSAAELKASTPPTPPFIAEPHVVAGAVTILSGKPKAGKSTWTVALAEAVVTPGAQFLDAKVVNGPVVLVSEESVGTLVHKLPQSDDLRVLTRENAWPKPDWQTLVNAAVAESLRVGAVLLIVDTLPYWAGLPAEREKDAGAALQTMEALIQAAAKGLAIVVPMHTRKGGGDDGEGVRGSNAFAGAADVILEMDRVPDRPRQRVLLALSRYPQVPGTMVVELDATDQWRVVSRDEDRSDPRTIAARNRVEADRNALLTALSSGASLTRAELQESVGAPSRQWHPILTELIGTRIDRSGTGRKGDPYRYQLLRAETAQPAAHNGAESEVSSFCALPLGSAETETEAVTAQLPCAESSDLAPLPGETFEAWERRIEAGAA